MQTLTRPQAPRSPYRSSRRPRGFSPWLIVGMVVIMIIALGAGIFFLVRPHFGSHAAAGNMDCALIVPSNPLSAQGLATPYQLVANDPANGPCNEANAAQSAFVQGAVFDPATAQISIYNPLVIDQGTQPARPTVVPNLPDNAVVALWFGFNGATLTLRDTNGSLQQGKCINGNDGTIFGQFAYCNAPAFFKAANGAIRAGKLVPPPLGTAKDGLPCPTVRNFAVVDQDQSDNVTTTYLITANGQSAQMTAANVAGLQTTNLQVNGSDNRLLAVALDGALGCTPWKAPDLADPGQMVPALPLNELQAAAQQAQPMALVPGADPMVLNNGNISLNKLNAYRRGVNQPPVANADAASTTTYCQNMVNIGIPRIVLDAPFTVKSAPPDPAVGNTLFTFLAQRFTATYGENGLNCAKLLGKPSPITTTLDGNGVAISAALNGQPINTNAAGTGTGTGTAATPPNCKINGMAVAGCMGSTTINGQTCTVAFADNTVSVTCPNAQGTGTGNGTGMGTGTGTGMGTGTGTGTTNLNPLNFNNTGTSNDDTMTQGNFDGFGDSYSAQALQNAGITPGKLINFNGVMFFWPSATAGTPDNVQANGQTIAVTPVQGAKTLAFLGSSTSGPSAGTATITYTDGTTQTFTLALSDWTLNAGTSNPLDGNLVVATTPYRNTTHGMQMHMPHVFYVAVDLQAGKTIKSVTLPTAADQGQLHIFAVGTK